MKDTDKFDNGPELIEDLDEDFEESIVTLEDEDGNKGDFEILDVIDYKDKDYAVLCSVDDSEDGGILILRVVDDPEDEESSVFTSPDTEEEADEVYNIFKEKYKDLIEFED